MMKKEHKFKGINFRKNPHEEEARERWGVNAEFKCLKTDGVQCPQTAGENGKLFGLAIFIKSILH